MFVTYLEFPVEAPALPKLLGETVPVKYSVLPKYHTSLSVEYVPVKPTEQEYTPGETYPPVAGVCRTCVKVVAPSVSYRSTYNSPVPIAGMFVSCPRT